MLRLLPTHVSVSFIGHLSSAKRNRNEAKQNQRKRNDTNEINKNETKRDEINEMKTK
jgi:hypothetical protein